MDAKLRSQLEDSWNYASAEAIREDAMSLKSAAHWIASGVDPASEKTDQELLEDFLATRCTLVNSDEEGVSMLEDVFEIFTEGFLVQLQQLPEWDASLKAARHMMESR